MDLLKRKGVVQTPAKFWEQGPRGKLKCNLCPRHCLIGPGQQGFCFTRANVDGELLALTYGRPTGFAVDPIEKKPLYHFLPGTPILSFGTAGCNLGCKFCQNWNMSTARAVDTRALNVSAKDVVEVARRERCQSIAFTYNEPTVFAEFVMETAAEARKEGIKNVAVTNGYITAEAAKEFYENIDAANVDLKAFTEKFYRKLALAKLAPVKKTLEYLATRTTVWLEVTTLLIPGQNDDPGELKDMCRWIAETLGPDVPLHFSAFHPDHRFREVERTPESTLHTAHEIAAAAGLKFVYLGNVASAAGQTTLCPSCGEALIERSWRSTGRVKIVGGKCAKCGEPISGVFSD